jgi:small subunit ribosomal protein S21
LFFTLNASLDTFASTRKDDMEIRVKNNDVNFAIKKLKRKLQQDGMFRELRNRRAYEKPNVRRRRKAKEAQRRMRKRMRKRSQQF